MHIHKPVFLWIHPQKTSRIRILSTKIAIVVLPVPGSEIVGPAELREREDESKTGGNWGEKGRGGYYVSPLYYISYAWHVLARVSEGVIQRLA